MYKIFTNFSLKLKEHRFHNEAKIAAKMFTFSYLIQIYTKFANFSGLFTEDIRRWREDMNIIFNGENTISLSYRVMSFL